MTYRKIGTILCGYLTPSKTVNITLIDTKLDRVVDTSSTECTESQHYPGLYRFDTSSITDEATELEIAYIMKDSTGVEYGGKIAIDNSLYGDITVAFQDVEKIIKDVQLGNWEIKDNQMIMLSQEGEEIARFDLTDLNGNPSMRAIFKRERVDI